MAAQVGVTYVDSPDGSTYWGLKYYNILLNFDHPDGSTRCGYINYDSLV